MAIEKHRLGALTTVASTALNALASTSLALGNVFDNTQGAAGDGYTLVDVELVVAFGLAPTVPSAITLWFLAAPDGVNYEDGDATTIPPRQPDLVFPVRAITTVQRVNIRAALPWGLVKPLLRNDGTGQPTAATGNTLKFRLATRESV